MWLVLKEVLVRTQRRGSGVSAEGKMERKVGVERRKSGFATVGSEKEKQCVAGS
jgi:hypothetical protein